MCERNLEKLVLSNEDDVVIPDCVEFPCGICWFGGIARGMKSIQKLSVKITAIVLMTSTYSHL